MAQAGFDRRQTRRVHGAPKTWRSPEELVEIGYAWSRVVMMNELHNGLTRSPRTRRIGRQILPTAHAAGVRHLAMEALTPEFARAANETRLLPDWPGYLGQPEMRELMAAALDLSWTLVPYEAQLEGSTEPGDWARINLREEEQARNLVSALEVIEGKLLVWCGNSHLSRYGAGEWQPMGLRFAELAGFEAFALDQTQGIGDNEHGVARRLADAYREELVARGGTAGFLAEDSLADWFGVDAILLSTDKALS